MNELDVLKRFRAEVPEPSTDAWLRARAAVAAVRIEISGPASRTPRRRGSRRRRRLVALASLGIAVVVVAVGVPLALDSPAPRGPVSRAISGSRTTARPEAAVIRARVVDALSGEEHTVFHTQSSTYVPGQPARGAQEWDYPWNGRPGQTVQQGGSISLAGALVSRWSLTFTVPAESDGTAAAGGLACNVSAQRIDVDYTDQTWQSSRQSCVAVTPGAEISAFVDPKTHQLLSNLRAIVADGLLHVVGYPSVDGQPTVELKWLRRQRRRSPSGSTPPRTCRCSR